MLKSTIKTETVKRTCERNIKSMEDQEQVIADLGKKCMDVSKPIIL